MRKKYMLLEKNIETLSRRRTFVENLHLTPSNNVWSLSKKRMFSGCDGCVGCATKNAVNEEKGWGLAVGFGLLVGMGIVAVLINL